ncbi:hypothetical protein Pyn_00075 [Prunus yedoensis var. nudiflora]|uniref:Uncharacterized protein n=1 Tax=Prunus yedoensis var. nudiflora TaxID=2094558 RepID=A0A314YKD1_PRUYE|nr:hypothetical protein Pyn_00075 [Prunus yedoensis var. nudiflora]
MTVAVAVQFQELWRVREVKLKGGDEHGRLKEKWVLGTKVGILEDKEEEEEGWVVEMLGLDLGFDGWREEGRGRRMSGGDLG